MNFEVSIDRELAKREDGLYQFVKMAWHIIEPGEPFKDNWHIELMCLALQKLYERVIRKLIINVPPGTGKSLIASVLWPVWIWTKDPGHRFLNASYSVKLVENHAGKTIQLIQSAWFQARWPTVVTADDARQKKIAVAKGLFFTTYGGMKFSTSIKGGGTGWHAHAHIIDDPIKPRETIERGRSVMPDKLALQDVIDWKKGTLTMRVVDIATLIQLIIMQRLHENDLVGYVLDNEEGWVKICLPMRFEPEDKTSIVLSDGTLLEDPRTREGELLHPARYPLHSIDEKEKEMGAQITAAQMQQRPAAVEGNIFKQKDFRHYEIIPQRFDYLLQSWDLAFKGTTGSDFIVGDLWGVLRGDAYLLPGWVEQRMTFTQTLSEMIRFQTLSPFHRQAHMKLVEAKANGDAVVDVLKSKIPGLILVNPQGGKEARAAAVSPYYESGNVWHPSKRLDPRIEKREQTLMGFPNVRNDDPVDTTSQALLRIFVRSSNLVAAMANVNV